jgi:hypothetical protein
LREALTVADSRSLQQKSMGVSGYYYHRVAANVLQLLAFTPFEFDVQIALTAVTMKMIWILARQRNATVPAGAAMTTCRLQFAARGTQETAYMDIMVSF